MTCTKKLSIEVNQWTLFLGAMLSVAVITSTVFGVDSPAPVNLGTSGDFALLSKTGISVTGPASVIGDVGVSPAAATFITGFGLVADPTNVFSTSSLVTGKIYAADYTSPTPVNLTTAISDMETAYTDAAGRTPDSTELYTGDLTGKTITPGVYKWSTGVLVAAAGFTLSGSASDVWIFQIAQNLEVANGAIVTLSGGARSSNIFWQVAGQVTLGTTAEMKGILLCQTAVVMNTNATLSGRALAQTAVTLDANTVIIPQTTTAAITNSLSAHRSALVQVIRNNSIDFTVPSNGKAKLQLFNVQGQAVATLFSGAVQAGKMNHVQFSTSGLGKGFYLSRLDFDGHQQGSTVLMVR